MSKCGENTSGNTYNFSAAVSWRFCQATDLWKQGLRVFSIPSISCESYPKKEPYSKASSLKPLHELSHQQLPRNNSPGCQEKILIDLGLGWSLTFRMAWHIFPHGVQLWYTLCFSLTWINMMYVLENSREKVESFAWKVGDLYERKPLLHFSWWILMKHFHYVSSSPTIFPFGLEKCLIMKPTGSQSHNCRFNNILPPFLDA